MVAGASFLYGKELVVSSKWYGKLATVLFYLAIIVSMILSEFNIDNSYTLILYYVAVAMTIFSLIMLVVLILSSFVEAYISPVLFKMYMPYL